MTYRLDGKRIVTQRKETNHAYFREITTATQAYILGFILADGWISKAANTYLGFEISKKDIQVLELIRDEICPDATINTRNRSIHYINDRALNSKPTAYLRITSGEIVNDLITLGLTPNKSYSACWPNISSDFDRDVLLGFFDGDGTICTSRNKKSGLLNPRWSIGTASTVLSDQIVELVRMHIGVQLNKHIRKGDKYHEFTTVYTSNYAAIKIDEWIHGDDLKMGLRRKMATVRYPELLERNWNYKHCNLTNEEWKQFGHSVVTKRKQLKMSVPQLSHQIQCPESVLYRVEHYAPCSYKNKQILDDWLL